MYEAKCILWFFEKVDIDKWLLFYGIRVSHIHKDGGRR